MIDSYTTILKSGMDEITIQKSRFIGYACPCATDEDAQRFIQEIREKHRDARHHCYAYIIGTNSGIMRYSDDGEPGGTAGMPMMDVLKNRHIVNCCVVVVRYFGGVLLGTGGLVRAYTQGCKIALDASDVVTMELSAAVGCKVSYSTWNLLQYALMKMPVKLEDVQYQEDVSFTLCVRLKDMNEAVRSVNSISEGKTDWSKPEERYIPWDL